MNIFLLILMVAVATIPFFGAVQLPHMVKARLRAIELCFAKAHEMIDEGRTDYEKAVELRSTYGSYWLMALQLHKRTFDQFYPDLEKRLNEL